jgi:hypothetical protein
MDDRREVLLELLADAAETISQATTSRDDLIREGADLDIPKVALATTAGLSRQAVYDILSRGLKRLGCGMNFSDIPGPGNDTVWRGKRLREEIAVFDRHPPRDQTPP